MGRLLIRYKYICIIIVVLIAGTSGFLLYPNFHTVIPDQVYRSAQLDQQQFTHYIQQHQIKSIVNLRGQSNDDSWYINELQVSKESNVQHYDLDLPASGITSPENMRALAQIILTSPKPLLIHCWRGADRTGLASAISLILLQDAPLAIAEAQISWEYGAVASDSIGKEEFHYYKLWLAKNNLTSSRENFMRWLMRLQSGSDYPDQK
ncbi:MAG: protein tyrosine phosphatase [Gammaproteobacteria bacterium]|nr:protein tyrosine phosphatase [Gammaproteobacteria bacterium]